MQKVETTVSAPQPDEKKPLVKPVAPDLALGGQVYRSLFGRSTSISAAIALGLSFVLPRGGDLGVSLCWFKRWTDLPCPGCGLTRSFVCLSHLRWQDAVHFHPFGPAIYLIAIASAAALLLNTERRMRLAKWFSLHQKGARIVYWTFVISFIVFGFIRLGIIRFLPGHFFANV